MKKKKMLMLLLLLMMMMMMMMMSRAWGTHGKERKCVKNIGEEN
jgi:preprotein translocase subunit YajC